MAMDVKIPENLKLLSQYLPVVTENLYKSWFPNEHPSLNKNSVKIQVFWSVSIVFTGKYV